jgi:aerobic C4-dicarboxylate transport protein
MKFLNSLFGRVVIALILGVGIGIVAPDFAKCLQPLGNGFVKLIQMIIGALVFSVVVTGICGSGDLKKVGRVGLKTIVYFELMTTFALVVGALMANTLHPGSGMSIDVHSLDSSAMSVYAERAKSLHSAAADFFLNLIPTTVFDAFKKGDILQVLVFAILFGTGLSLAGEAGRPLFIGLEAIATVLFKMIGLIINLAPIGVLGAVTFTTGKDGVASLSQLALLVLVFYASCAVFIVLVLVCWHRPRDNESDRQLRGSRCHCLLGA